MKKDHWDTSVFKQSVIIRQLKALTDSFKNFSQWPNISDYKNSFKQQGLDIKPVPQADIISCFEEQYEPRVYLKKELQTRTENWHDFFNAMIWLKFPETKKTLNKLHYYQATKREKGSNRSTLENRITQFDECGAIIISNDNSLLEMIKNHQWQELFINQKQQFEKNIQIVIFGHAIFEKALNPYIGMTCHCILLKDETLLEKVQGGSNQQLDRLLANMWEKEIAINPLKFNALPLLGAPGYWPKQDEEFYRNTKYFR